MADRSWRFRIGRRSIAPLIVLLAAASLVGACARSEGSATVTHLGLPGHVNQHVSAASDGASVVALTWAATSDDTGTNIFAAVSADGGASFADPVRVNAVDGQANVNGEQPPRVAVVRDQDRASVVVLWTAKGDGGTALLSARSTDGGRTFGPTAALPGVSAPGNRGWESLAAGGDDRLFALWLDHRDTAPGRAAHAHHQHGSGPADADGAARAQRSQLFVSSLDGVIAPRGIARGACYCCKTALTTGRDGTIYAAWRHVYAGNQRDIAFTLSRDGGRSFDEPIRVSEDGWELDGCPENGPALGVAAGRVHVVWPTLVRDARGETLRLFHSARADGQRFTPRVALPTSGAAYHPQVIVAPDGSLLVTWDERTGGQRQVRVARGEADAGGGFVFALVPGEGELPGTYPALTSTASHAVLAWAQPGETESRIAVRRIAHP
jgi:hypothetical protein